MLKQFYEKKASTSYAYEDIWTQIHTPDIVYTNPRSGMT